MSHSISPLHPTRFSVCFSVRFFVRWMILLLVATIAIDASAQSQRRKKKRSWKEKVEYADSIRLEIRRASDEGRLLQWGDSILRAQRDSGSMDEKKYNALRKRLVKYDQLLHAGNAILAERYQRINYDTAYIMRHPDAGPSNCGAISREHGFAPRDAMARTNTTPRWSRTSAAR